MSEPKWANLATPYVPGQSQFPALGFAPPNTVFANLSASAGPRLDYNISAFKSALNFSVSDLGLGNSATKDVGTTLGTVAAGDDSRFAGFSNASNLTSGTLPPARLPGLGTPGTYGNAASVPVLTTDASGRVSTVTPTTIATAKAITGAVSRNFQAHVADVVYIDDFNAAGDGSTDDLTPLTNFFNSAIARPGVLHGLRAKVYATSNTLPTINVSNVQVLGTGIDQHEYGAVSNGTVVKWIGASGGTVQTIAPVESVTSQRLSNIVFKGIMYDCNSLANYGLIVKSIRNSHIEGSSSNALNTGLSLTVSTTLGENGSSQRNIVKWGSRQQEAPNGLGLRLTGNSTSNWSFNEIYVDGTHANQPLVTSANADNNDWRVFRAYKIPAGTATESYSGLGSNNYGENTRAERFWQFSANTPPHIYGSGYTYPATSMSFISMDAENGTPEPTVDAGAIANWRRDTSSWGDQQWIAFTPTVSAGSGSFSSVSASLYYRKIGRILFWRLSISIPSNGTAASYIRVTMPFASTSLGSFGAAACGKERAVTGKAVLGYMDGGSGTMDIQNYDGSYPGTTGAVIGMSGFYNLP